MNRPLAWYRRAWSPSTRRVIQWTIVVAGMCLAAGCGRPSVDTGNGAATALLIAGATASPVVDATSLATAAPPTPAGLQIRGSRLVTPTQGWALTNRQLLWLSQDGRQQIDITPPGVVASTIRGVFFFNLAQGWAVTSGTTDPARLTSLEVYRTDDGGKTWQQSRIDAPNWINTESVSQPASIDFVDARHGWVMAHRATGSNFDLGDLFQTVDGG